MGVAKGVRGHPRLSDLGAITCASKKSRQRRIRQRFLTVYACAADQEHERNVIRFVLRLADELDLIGLWGFQYALTCSRPRLDAFGGGAHVIDLGARKSIGWTSTQEWLAAALNGEDVDAFCNGASAVNG